MILTVKFSTCTTAEFKSAVQLSKIKDNVIYFVKFDTAINADNEYANSIWKGTQRYTDEQAISTNALNIADLSANYVSYDVLSSGFNTKNLSAESLSVDNQIFLSGLAVATAEYVDLKIAENSPVTIRNWTEEN